MSRAFSPLVLYLDRTWGFTPDWYEAGLWPLGLLCFKIGFAGG